MTEKWVKEVYEKILTKEEQVAKRNAHKIPYTTKDGVFDDKSGKEICWWTNGFWGGMMWQLYHATGNEAYKKQARYFLEERGKNPAFFASSTNASFSSEEKTVSNTKSCLFLKHS